MSFIKLGRGRKGIGERLRVFKESGGERDRGGVGSSGGSGGGATLCGVVVLGVRHLP